MAYSQHNDGVLPAHAGVPTLKIPLGVPKNREQQLMTPRSMAAAERAVAEQEAMAARSSDRRFNWKAWYLQNDLGADSSSIVGSQVLILQK